MSGVVSVTFGSGLLLVVVELCPVVFSGSVVVVAVVGSGEEVAREEVAEEEISGEEVVVVEVTGGVMPLLIHSSCVKTFS